MIIHQVEQRSPEWFALRLGHVTGSVYAKLAQSARQKHEDFSDTQMKVLYKLASERMTIQEQQEGYINESMQHGIDTELEALDAYSIMTGKVVDTIGFCEYSNFIGCSPDGVGVEVKCPDSGTHLLYMHDEDAFRKQYEPQCQLNMFCLGVSTWDLVSYDSRFMDPSKQIHIVTIQFDSSIIERLGYITRKLEELTGIKEVLL